MPKNKNIDKKPKKPTGKKKLTSQGKKRPIKPEKTVKVLLPVPIPGRGVYEPEPPPCESELSYKDAMMCVQLEKLAAKGFNNDEIIALLGISRSTFYKRLKEDMYFSYCLMKHRDEALNHVECNLHKAANGFEYMEQHCSANGKVVTLMKAKTPDVAAAKFILTNKRSNEWKNKVETTHQAGESMNGMVFAIKRRED